MKTKALILGFICLFLIFSCDREINNPYSPEIQEPNLIKMIGKPLWFLGVKTPVCPVSNWYEYPYFGYNGRIDVYGRYHGILKNTGEKTAYKIKLTIKIFTEDKKFLGQITVPSNIGCCKFYQGDNFFDDCTLNPDEEVSWIAYLPHGGNDWRFEVYSPKTEFIIEWE